MSRQRRRRINTENELNPCKPEAMTEPFMEEHSDKVIFMEEVNYKMDFKNTSTPSNLVLLRSEEFAE